MSMPAVWREFSWFWSFRGGVTRVALKLTGLSPQIDWIFSTATLRDI